MLQKIPDLLGRFIAPEKRRMEAGKRDVIAFAAQTRIRLQDQKIALGGDDAQLRNGWRWQGTDEAGTMVGKLPQRWTNPSEERGQARGDM